jgi:hypothetical protein
LGAPHAGVGPMTDQDLIVEAIDEAQRILGEYIAPGPRDAAATIKALLGVFDRSDVVAALNRLKAGYGLYVVKQEPDGRQTRPSSFLRRSSS